MNITTTTEQGLIIGRVEKPEAETVSIYLSAQVCPENSPAITAKMILFTELLLSGTATFSRDQIQEKFRLLGSNIDVSYAAGRITLTVSTLANKIKPTLTLLTQIINNPAFSLAEIKRAKQTLINQLELAKEDAKGIAHAQLNNAFIHSSDNRYKHSPESLSLCVTKISQSELKAVHKLFLNRQWTMTVGGAESSLNTVIQTIKKIKKGYLSEIPETVVAALDSHKPAQLLQHEVKSKQNLELSFGAALPLNLQNPDLAAFQFGLAVLGKWGGFAGRLMSTVREKEGLTYGIYARTEEIGLTATGYWRIMSFFSPKDVKRGITSTLREVKKIHEKGITTSEWERFIDILKTGERLTYDSLSSTTALVHGNLLLGRSWVDYQAYRQKLYSCTQKEVNLALRKYLLPQLVVISIAGPVGKAKEDLATLF
ncbi:MAG TPA: insulinase family protein [Candidatus Paceibacterota bacterium]|nr:insulinase family protein [Candidatus Paceibacterota bacterium]HMO82927.1 insulinase family protein [Candidatus Paceibacterota bacterium]